MSKGEKEENRELRVSMSEGRTDLDIILLQEMNDPDVVHERNGMRFGKTLQRRKICLRGVESAEDVLRETNGVKLVEWFTLISRVH